MLNEANGHFNLTREKGLPRPGFSKKEILSFPQNFFSSEKLTQIKLSNFSKLEFLKHEFCSNTDETIWHLAIWQNWCFGQSYQSRIEVFINYSLFYYSFLSQFLSWEENLREWENIFFRISRPKSCLGIFVQKKRKEKKPEGFNMHKYCCLCLFSTQLNIELKTPL